MTDKSLTEHHAHHDGKRVELDEAPAAGVCSDCQAGDHQYHRPHLGGICIGCACPVVT